MEIINIIGICILVMVGSFTLTTWSIEIVKQLFKPKENFKSHEDYIRDKVKKQYTL